MIVLFRIAAFFLVSFSFLLIGFALGKNYRSSEEKEVRKSLLGQESPLAYRIKHACGKGWESYDWSIVAGSILISCSQTQGGQNGAPTWYASKTVTLRR